MNAWKAFIELPFWVYSYAGWALGIIPFVLIHTFPSSSHVFLEAVILPISSQLLLDFISKHLGTYFSFNSHLSRRDDIYFQHHFNRWYKKIIQWSWISFPKSQNSLAAEWMKNAGPRAYLVSSGRTLCVQCRDLGSISGWVTDPTCCGAWPK